MDYRLPSAVSITDVCVYDFFTCRCLTTKERFAIAVTNSGEGEVGEVVNNNLRDFFKPNEHQPHKADPSNRSQPRGRHIGNVILRKTTLEGATFEKNKESSQELFQSINDFKRRHSYPNDTFPGISPPTPSPNPAGHEPHGSSLAGKSLNVPACGATAEAAADATTHVKTPMFSTSTKGSTCKAPVSQDSVQELAEPIHKDTMVYFGLLVAVQYYCSNIPYVRILAFLIALLIALLSKLCPLTEVLSLTKPVRDCVPLGHVTCNESTLPKQAKAGETISRHASSVMLLIASTLASWREVECIDTLFHMPTKLPSLVGIQLAKCAAYLADMRARCKRFANLLCLRPLSVVSVWGAARRLPYLVRKGSSPSPHASGDCSMFWPSLPPSGNGDNHYQPPSSTYARTCRVPRSQDSAQKLDKPVDTLAMECFDLLIAVGCAYSDTPYDVGLVFQIALLLLSLTLIPRFNEVLQQLPIKPVNDCDPFRSQMVPSHVSFGLRSLTYHLRVFTTLAIDKVWPSREPLLSFARRLKILANTVVKSCTAFCYRLHQTLSLPDTKTCSPSLDSHTLPKEVKRCEAMGWLASPTVDLNVSAVVLFKPSWQEVECVKACFRLPSKLPSFDSIHLTLNWLFCTMVCATVMMARCKKFIDLPCLQPDGKMISAFLWDTVGWLPSLARKGCFPVLPSLSASGNAFQPSSAMVQVFPQLLPYPLLAAWGDQPPTYQPLDRSSLNPIHSPVSTSSTPEKPTAFPQSRIEAVTQRSFQPIGRRLQPPPGSAGGRFSLEFTDTASDSCTRERYVLIGLQGGTPRQSDSGDESASSSNSSDSGSSDDSDCSQSGGRGNDAGQSNPSGGQGGGASGGGDDDGEGEHDSKDNNSSDRPKRKKRKRRKFKVKNDESRHSSPTKNNLPAPVHPPLKPLAASSGARAAESGSEHSSNFSNIVQDPSTPSTHSIPFNDPGGTNGGAEREKLNTANIFDGGGDPRRNPLTECGGSPSETLEVSPPRSLHREHKQVSKSTEYSLPLHTNHTTSEDCILSTEFPVPSPPKVQHDSQPHNLITERQRVQREPRPETVSDEGVQSGVAASSFKHSLTAPQFMGAPANTTDEQEAQRSPSAGSPETLYSPKHTQPTQVLPNTNWPPLQETSTSRMPSPSCSQTILSASEPHLPTQRLFPLVVQLSHPGTSICGAEYDTTIHKKKPLPNAVAYCMPSERPLVNWIPPLAVRETHPCPRDSEVCVGIYACVPRAEPRADSIEVFETLKDESFLLPHLLQPFNSCGGPRETAFKEIGLPRQETVAAVLEAAWVSHWGVIRFRSLPAPSPKFVVSPHQLSHRALSNTNPPVTSNNLRNEVDSAEVARLPSSVSGCPLMFTSPCSPPRNYDNY